MADRDTPAGERRPRAHGDDVPHAGLDAEQMISRMQDIVTEAIQPDGDPEEGFHELIEELDPAPEAGRLRSALGMDKDGSRKAPKGEPRDRRGA